jgi:hypothetical protein
MKQKRRLVLIVTLLVVVVLQIFMAKNQVDAFGLLRQLANTVSYLPLVYAPLATPTSSATPIVVEPTSSATPGVVTPGATSTVSGQTPTRTSTVNPPTSTLPAVTPSVTIPVPEGVIIVDHNSVALFDQIPDQYLQAARAIPMVFQDRSVGQNIHEALNCLAAASWAQSPGPCRVDFYDTSGTTWLHKRYEQADLAAGTVPPRIRFTPDAVKYNRSNWTYAGYFNDQWQDVMKAFFEGAYYPDSNTGQQVYVAVVPTYLNSKQVLTFQFSYLDVSENRDIASAQTGFFRDLPRNSTPSGRWDISDVQAFQAAHPDKLFFFWTTSLARSIGSSVSTSFNDQTRQYVRNNGQILFDVADILSHDDQGNACYDNRDGVQYCNANACESDIPGDRGLNDPDGHANDGQNYPAICQIYTSEIDGGHLGAVSGGKIKVSKAFWVLMAQIAGWRP